MPSPTWDHLLTCTRATPAVLLHREDLLMDMDTRDTTRDRDRVMVRLATDLTDHSVVLLHPAPEDHLVSTQATHKDSIPIKGGTDPDLT